MSTPSTSPSPTSPSVAATRAKRITLEGVQFDSGQVTLTKRSMASLKMSEATLRAHPSVRVEVQGYTDNQERDALKLSARRANVVKDYLIHEGVDPARLTTQSLGTKYPVASNDFPEGRAANRRVELVTHD